MNTQRNDVTPRRHDPGRAPASCTDPVVIDARNLLELVHLAGLVATDHQLASEQRRRSLNA